MAVVGRGGTLTAQLLRKLLPHPVVELGKIQFFMRLSHHAGKRQRVWLKRPERFS